jgi:hypothetical protein
VVMFEVLPQLYLVPPVVPFRVRVAKGDAQLRTGEELPGRGDRSGCGGGRGSATLGLRVPRVHAQLGSAGVAGRW